LEVYDSDTDNRSASFSSIRPEAFDVHESGRQTASHGLHFVEFEYWDDCRFPVAE
jgi:hypothetical protein